MGGGESVGLVMVVSLALFGMGAALAILASVLSRFVERLRRRRTTIAELLVAGDISQALQTFEENRGDAQCVVLVWVGADGRLRLLHAGLADLEVGGLLQLALSREEG